jgi:hypothetical protein
MAVIAESLSTGIQALSDASDWILATHPQDPQATAAASVNYLMLVGYVCGGWQMARAALKAQVKLAAGDDPAFYEAKLVTVRFYAEQILPKAGALMKAVISGSKSVMALGEEQF